MELLAHFVKPITLPTKLVVSQEFKGMARMKLAMIKHGASALLMVPINSLNPQLATYSPHSHFIICHTFLRLVEPAEKRELEL